MKPTCPNCNTALQFRRWSNRKPAKSEALARCPSCGEKFQIRYFAGQATSEPYQTNKPQDKRLVKQVRSVRLSDSQMEAIEAGRLHLIVINRRITVAV